MTINIVIIIVIFLIIIITIVIIVILILIFMIVIMLMLELSQITVNTAHAKSHLELRVVEEGLEVGDIVEPEVVVGYDDGLAVGDLLLGVRD